MALELSDSQAVAAIADLAVEASRVEIISLPFGDERTAYLRHGKQLTSIVVPPRARHHTVYAIDDFIAAVAFWDVKTIFHAPDKIVGVLNDLDRRDLIVMPLEFDPRWTELVNLQKPQQKDHRALLRWLRVTMRGTVAEDQTTLDVIKHLNFKAEMEGESHIAKGTEKIGKSISQKVIAGGNIPEDLHFSVPVYANAGLSQQFPVLLALDVNLEHQNFTLQTVPSEISKVLNVIAQQIQDQLTDECEEVAVFRGSL